MQLTEVRINLCGGQATRLKAFCSLTFDNTFVIRDVKLIEGNDGLFVAPVQGPDRGYLKQFFSVVNGAECSGPVFNTDNSALFVSL